jgi:very-short-patch-repair endonuclease
MNAADGRLNRIAGEQHRLVHRHQALRAGLTARQIQTRLDMEVFQAVHRNVYLVGSGPLSFKQAVLAAGLAAGPTAVATHRSAAGLWLLRGIERPPVEITVAGSRRPMLPGVVVHRRTGIEPVDVTRRSGIPVTTPARTLIDLGAVAPDLVEGALDDAYFRGLVTARRLWAALERAGGRGVRGSRVLRELLSARDPAMAPTESQLELLLVRALRATKAPDPVRQYIVETPTGRIRLDFAYPDVKLAIEADGLRWHSSRADLQRDRARANQLVQLGWRILTFTWDDLTRRPAEVGATVLTELYQPLPFAG